ncbi:flagellar hook capping FlgD N-terminal domain-containing protein [Aestuariibius sp. 2305UL40-4]|uniref:flagellar hook capping FlgD N-terminal domain-containing protein n=1 Tax=Aestuariibius violaceus TaxID=3234132 RepID=UPI00345E4EB6
MEIQSFNSATPTGADVATDTSAVISSDFETFLNMLTTQLENQDPLNPVDSADYAAQLAQFSAVEQQVLTNDLLETLIQQSQVTGLSDMAGWVGMEARATGAAHFNGAPVRLVPDPSPLAQSTVLIVTNSAGQEVAVEPLPSGGGEIDWVGYDEDGRPLPPGEYTFRIESTANGEIIEREAVAHYTRVNEVRVEGGVNVAILAGGVSVPATEITALRVPS